MSPESKTLLAQIARLPRQEQAELVDEMQRTLRVETDTAWHVPWTDELERRRREIAECARAGIVAAFVPARTKR